MNKYTSIASLDGATVITQSGSVQEFLYNDQIKDAVKVKEFKLVDNTALIEGVPELFGAPVTVTDLRAGAALIVAGLMAKGVTEIYETSFIDRGYERIEEKLRSLGADIRREPV